MTKANPNSKKIKLRNQQVNQYDKILHENLEAALPGLIRNLLNIYAVNTEELPDDIQYTKERKPDVLKKVTDEKGATFVLHNRIPGEGRVENGIQDGGILYYAVATIRA